MANRGPGAQLLRPPSLLPSMQGSVSVGALPDWTDRTGQSVALHLLYSLFFKKQHPTQGKKGPGNPMEGILSRGELYVTAFEFVSSDIVSSLWFNLFSNCFAASLED